MKVLKMARLVEPGKIGLFATQTFIDPVPEDHVVVKISHVGICGSDLHYFRHGGLGSFKKDMPMNIGHEASGVVSQSRSDRFSEGDRIAIEPIISCGKCYYCRREKFNLCDNRSFIDYLLRDYVILHEDQLLKLPEEISLIEGLMLEPLSIALHAVERSGVGRGDFVSVVGLGTIGLLIMKVCEILGAITKGYDILGYRCRFAEHYCNPYITSTLEELSGSSDIVFDAAGTQEAISKTFGLADKAGTVVLVGIPEVDWIKYNPHKARMKELDIYNVRNSNVSLDDTLEFYLEHQYMDLEFLVSHHFHLKKAHTAFETASEYKDRCIKVVVDL